jgi:alkylhydroperoxidase family enzyme
LASEILESRGNVTDAELAAARQAGITDGEIAEVVAHVALNVLTNYFNVLARTEVDFPLVSVTL